ncbi:hypothetical protein G3N95_24185 [Paraburkholderia sp. Tr-20389]|uniref:hypothetical protein n=1 Tax=Paraburkholderia sp. Tr-20389 TaxID=2703903 RepID=UPI00197E7151|nr:hypothetical protein [Paraburkholderia sp. Tr-20389]MBN3756061.1 hypothetical protein [Paraburkholderia sp. Tr-20389]
MKMIATKSFSYGGRSRRPGDEFEVADRDVKLLAAVKRAKPAPPSPPPPLTEPTPVARDMPADQPVTTEADEGKPRKGRYRRRDVRAEDDTTDE